MAIPTVPGSEIDVNTPASSVKLDAGALNAGTRGRLAIAGAVEGLGDQAQQLGNDLAKVRQARIAADADFRMRSAQHAFVQSTQGDENESEWAERAKHTFDTVRDDVYAQHDVPPAMRQQLDESLKGWGQTLQIKAQTLAAVQSVNRATLAVRKSYDEAGRDGDAAGMQAAIDLGKVSKLDPVEMRQMENEIPRTLALTAIENGLRVNPQGTHELLSSGASLPIKDQNGKDIVPSKVFAPKELQGLVNSARIQASNWQRTNFEGMLQDSADPITGMVPDAVIKSKVDSGEINVRAGKALADAQDRKMKAEKAAADAAARRDSADLERLNKQIATDMARDDRDRYNVLQTQIHDPTAWAASPDSYAAELVADAAGISNEALRKKSINDAKRQLDAFKKTGQLAVRPLESQIMELMRQDRETQGAMVPLAVSDVAGVDARSGFLGIGSRAAAEAQTKYTNVPGGIAAVRKEDFDMSQFPGVSKDQLISEINVHAAKVENEMREWFKTEEGVKATFDSANAHRQELERPYVMDAVRATLSKRAPATVTTEEEFNSLPSGARFIFNGRAGVKR